VLQLPFLANTLIWQRADEVRGYWWNGKLPVDVDLLIEKHFRLALTPIPGLRELITVDALILSDLKEIVYALDTPDVRLRFSLAHELGHLVLHRKQIELFRPKSYADWQEKIGSFLPGLYDRAELQASEFAGRLLVPPKRLKAAVVNLRTKIEKARKATSNISLEELGSYVARQIARQFGVSERVIQIRLAREGILSQA
jgi:Zn-dependent peptidase ImmA (M78 family)